jgi:uncharacterized membrane protein YeiH
VVLARPATRAHLLTVVDLAATLVFAVEGAELAAAADLDIIGVLVAAFVTALAGGIIRDVLIGDVPPAALRLVSYPLAAFAGGGLIVLLSPTIERVPTGIVDVLDALGLSLFCVAGAAKALDRRLHPLIAALIGALTAVGGGTVRDVLLSEIPAVLRVDVYATAALAGAVVMVVASLFGLARAPAMLLGATCCLLLRLAAIHWAWNLPKVR